MSALLLNLTLFHHNDLVSVDDGAESVSNHYHCEALLLEQCVQGCLDLMLTLGVEGACRFIEEEDLGLADQGTSDRDPLLLPS